MYIEWYHVLAIVLSFPGLIVLFIVLAWSGLMIASLRKSKAHEYDGSAAFLRGLAIMAFVAVILVFALGFLIFGPVGLLYACACFSIFLVPVLLILVMKPSNSTRINVKKHIK